MNLSVYCLQHSFLWLVPFFLTNGPETLHLQLRRQVDNCETEQIHDLRLLDYEARGHLEVACASQVVRTVLGARNVANQYTAWYNRWRSSDFEFFARRHFGEGVSVDTVIDMVKNGARLNSLQATLNDVYMPFIVAVNWTWFSTATDATVFHLCSALLRLPELRGLRAILSGEWPAQAAYQYHGSSSTASCMVRGVADSSQNKPLVTHSSATPTNLSGSDRPRRVAGHAHITSGFRHRACYPSARAARDHTVYAKASLPAPCHLWNSYTHSFRQCATKSFSDDRRCRVQLYVLTGTDQSVRHAILKVAYQRPIKSFLF